MKNTKSRGYLPHRHRNSGARREKRIGSASLTTYGKKAGNSGRQEKISISL
jgi:hypothetical protein